MFITSTTGRLLLGAAIVMTMLLAGAWQKAQAQVACPGQGHSAGAYAINLEHVFCGEVNAKNRFVGFHSRPGGLNPATISTVTVTAGSENGNGIYDATVFWNTARPGAAKPSNPSKFSTLFPDDCDQDQIEQSITYAADHLEAACPAGSPTWTKCGYNRPDPLPTGDAGKYCVGKDASRRFSVAMAIAGTTINTAFPINVAP
ncbi:EndoU domain-containing protein [Thalassospira mesophila]|uniref:EndoU domain-containing protein n=1 Tax=Thalassospira mesophila TaxID=1293891 RepID=UPI000A1E961F|nr:EndoU domain-containing protein [Thalassospira mesophila]